MNTIEAIQGSGGRVQTLRLILLIIIVGTFPFYCLGVYIIGSAPASGIQRTATATPVSATFTPLGMDRLDASSATITPLPPPNATMTPLSPLQPTPRQFIPPTTPAPQVIATRAIASAVPTVFQPAVTIVSAATPVIADADGDGVADSDDDCPSEGGFADNRGCPYADDMDRDGFRDALDSCPQEYAPGTARGCRDFDDDGLDTAQDECPRQAGPSANKGCPLSADAGG